MRIQSLPVYLIGGLLSVILFACKTGGADTSDSEKITWEARADFQQRAQDPEIYRKAVKSLTDIIVYDIFSPPVASRIYAYPNIAAYEVLVKNQPDYVSLAGQLTDFTAIPEPDADQEVCYPLAAVQAFLNVGRAMIFSEDLMDSAEIQVLTHFQDAGVPLKVYNASREYGIKVAGHVLAWADKDQYKQTRTDPQYTVTEEEGRWTPTPPDYMAGIEPSWNKIRPFIIDSATQFIPVRPTAYNMNKSSRFFKEVMEVYNVGRQLDDEQKAIAEFWDCNPFVTTHIGHVMYATKKITPGGHWIGITDIVTRKARCDFMQTFRSLCPGFHCVGRCIHQLLG